MTPIDWRELYAANQATIKAALDEREAEMPAPPADSPQPTAKAPLEGGRIASRRAGGRLPTAPLKAGPFTGPGRAGPLPAAAPGVARSAAPGPGGGRPLVYVPDSLDRREPAPLVCMLHGCTQDPGTFAAATRMNGAADRYGFVVVYPGQDRGSNPQGCWNWFLPQHQRRGAGEPAAIARIVQTLVESESRCKVDPGRVFVAGLSSGGAMAATLTACYPELWAGVAVHSGLPYRSASDLPSALQAMSHGSGKAESLGLAAHDAMGDRARPVPSLVIHGSDDRTVAPVNASQVLRQSMTANHLASPQSCDHEVGRPSASWRSGASGGHSYTRSQWIDERGELMHELLEIDGLGHAWSGGAPGGSHTDPRGPSATEAICTFFSLSTANAPLP